MTTEAVDLTVDDEADARPFSFTSASNYNQIRRGAKRSFTFTQVQGVIDIDDEEEADIKQEQRKKQKITHAETNTNEAEREEEPVDDSNDDRELDENTFEIDYFAGLHLHDDGNSVHLLKYTGYDELEDGELDDGGKDEADEFVTKLYKYIQTLDMKDQLNRRVRIVQIYRTQAPSQHETNFFAKLANKRVVNISTLSRPLIDGFIVACGYEVPRVQSESQTGEIINMIFKEEGREDFQAPIVIKKEEDSGMFHLPSFVGPPVPVPRNIKKFKRVTVVDTYHGGPQETFPTPGKKWREKGFTTYATFKYSYNPDLPVNPGEHGFCLCGSPFEYDEQFPVYVWKKGCFWLYMGHYTANVTAEVPHEDWLKLSANTRHTWITGILHRGWGKGYLDQAGLVREQDKTYENVSNALATGAITLAISVLTCKRFDEAYYQRLVDTARGNKKKVKKEKRVITIKKNEGYESETF